MVSRSGEGASSGGREESTGGRKAWRIIKEEILVVMELFYVLTTVVDT